MGVEQFSEQRAVERLEEALGYRFQDPSHLRLALTHRSFSNEMGQQENYERLEFLGDSVLGLVSAHWLYTNFPHRPEGELAKLKSYLVSTRVLSRRARELGIGALVRLGVGEERSGGRTKTSILADTMESIFGALFLDGGLDAARPVIEAVLETAMEERSHIRHADSKTQLQELVQARGWRLPEYRLAAETGPDHRKTFTVECWIEHRLASSAAGASKKQAEQRAAASAIEQLDLAAKHP